MFCDVTAYIDDSVGPMKSLLSSLIRFYGGTLADMLDSAQTSVSHVFVNGKSHQTIADLKSTRRRLKEGKLFRILDYNFVQQSISTGTMADVTKFEL